MTTLKPVSGMTHPVRFKEDGRAIDKMLKATIYVQRKDGTGKKDDDVIDFYEDDDYQEMVRIKYSTPELQRNAVFYLPIPRAINYLGDILKTFRHDADPFEYVQVSTQIHPSVLYHVADMDNAEIRHLIEDTVEAALRRPVRRVKKD